MKQPATFSDEWLAALLQEGQHSIICSMEHKLHVPDEVKRQKEPDTEATKALKRATRNRLQDAFYFTWCMVGGAPDYWVTEYQFHPDRKWRFDFANPATKIAVEVNGGQWSKSGHSTGTGLQRDAEKLNAAQQLGWTVYVFTTSMLQKREAVGNVKQLLEKVSACG